jgi:hypothetical protein
MLKDARKISSSYPRYYKSLEGQILAGILKSCQFTGKSIIWAYQIYDIKTRKLTHHFWKY